MYINKFHSLCAMCDPELSNYPKYFKYLMKAAFQIFGDIRDLYPNNVKEIVKRANLCVMENGQFKVLHDDCVHEKVCKILKEKYGIDKEYVCVACNTPYVEYYLRKGYSSYTTIKKLPYFRTHMDWPEWNEKFKECSVPWHACFLLFWTRGFDNCVIPELSSWKFFEIDEFGPRSFRKKKMK